MDTLFVGLRVVVSLAAVLGLLWVIQRKVSKTGRVTRTAKHVTVVARQGISGKASVAVVDVEGVRYVLGVTENSVSVLGSREAPQDAVVTAIAAAPVAQTPTSNPAPTFAQMLAAQPEAVVPAAVPIPVVDSPRRAARAAAAAPTAASGQQAPLAGSILSSATWKQAAAAMRSQKRA